MLMINDPRNLYLREGGDLDIYAGIIEEVLHDTMFHSVNDRKTCYDGKY